MQDYVNEHLANHYKTNPRRSLAPVIYMADGTWLSVQASRGAWCEPRKDWGDMGGGKFSKVEVEHRRNKFAAAYFLTYADDDSAPAGFVPVKAVNRYIALCGGLAPTD